MNSSINNASLTTESVLESSGVVAAGAQHDGNDEKDQNFASSLKGASTDYTPNHHYTKVTTVVTEGLLQQDDPVVDLNKSFSGAANKSMLRSSPSSSNSSSNSDDEQRILLGFIDSNTMLHVRTKSPRLVLKKKASNTNEKEIFIKDEVSKFDSKKDEEAYETCRSSQSEELNDDYEVEDLDDEEFDTISEEDANPNTTCPSKTKTNRDSEFCDEDPAARLSPELRELAQLLERKQAGKPLKKKWDWRFIEANATRALKALIRSKKQNSSFHTNPMRIVVGQIKTPLFCQYRGQLRSQAIRNEHVTTTEAKREDRKHFKNHEGTEGSPQKGVLRSRRNKNRRSNVFSQEEPSKSRKEKKQKKVHQRPSEQVGSNNHTMKKRRISKALLHELAQLFAKAKHNGHTWAYMESKASASLSAYMAFKAANDSSNYIAAPLSSLVPAHCQDEFDKAVMDFIDDNDDDAQPEPQFRRNRNAADAALGPAFVEERKRRIQTFAATLRAELHEFETRECQLWNAFLQFQREE